MGIEEFKSKNDFRYSVYVYNHLWTHGDSWENYLDYARKQDDCVVTENNEVHDLVTGAIMREEEFIEHCKELDDICSYGDGVL